MLDRLIILATALLLLAVTLASAPALAASPLAAVTGGSDSPPDEAALIPPDATPSQLNELLAAMSDEQVRRLLLDELQKDLVQAAPEPGPTGLAGLLDRTRNFVQQVRERFSYLFSGAAQAPRLLPEAFRKSVTGDGAYPPGRLALGLAVVTLLWFAARWLVFRQTAGLRSRIEDAPVGVSVFSRAGRLLARAVFDLLAVACTALVTLIPYVLIFNEPAKGRPVIFAWLAAIFVVEVVRAGSRFLLAPDAAPIRFLPLSDSTAGYLHKWVLRAAWVVAVGVLAGSLVGLTRGSELVFLLILACTGFVVAAMVSLLALWNRNRVAEAIRRAAPSGTLRHQLAGTWHAGVILYAMAFWFFWVLALLVFGRQAMLAGVYTLLLVPTYLLADWATQRLVAFASTLARSSSSGGEEGEESGLTRFHRFLSAGFRFLVLAAAGFLLLRIWGINLEFGRATVGAGIDILLTLVLAYIFWVFVSGYIESKLKEGLPEGDEETESEAGGPGGDRFATLLQLLRKFIFAAITVVSTLIILSSLGVDIGPLIAGASVFGIAIGFGAQTLVKDIISGIFFLMDDAFRVGDYIIVGGARGTVEAISLRSFKLRHHLGPLYTIPFGSINEVENMTRDWAVMKLQYLVPFDTDIQLVKKIIKKINKEIRAIPELNEFMLSDIKSQGVKAMEEYGMRMRVKFMTKPGGQFTLRKLVLAKMRKHFEDAGIEFAKPRVSVHIPGREQLTPEEEAHVAAAASQAVDKDKAGQKGGASEEL